jgi:hypothetical protein
MRRYLQAAGSRSSGRPDYHHTPNGGCGASGTGRLAAFRNYTQSFTEQPVAPLDLFPRQQILHPHPVALLRSRRILGGNPLVGEQLEIVLCCRYSDIQARRHLSPRGRAVLRQKSNDGHPGQVPESVNDRLHMSCGLRVGIPGHTCNLAVPTCVLA